jgi:small subunit ribosomal protein S8
MSTVSDPISDMLTRIRNGGRAGLASVDIPHSKMKGELARIFKREGFIADATVEGDGVRKMLRVTLKYTFDRKPVIQGLRRMSRPGLRRYAAADKLPRVLGGVGVAVLSTSSGVMTDKEARKAKVGGEVLCTIW